MAVEVGAVLNEGNAANGIWVPASTLRRSDGTLAKFPSLTFDRHCPGSILVDATTGTRFVNEGFHYQHFGETAQTKGITRIYMISDARAVSKYGIGMVKPAPFSAKPWVRRGYLVEGATLEELARKINVPVRALIDTVTNFNRYADAGHDPDFARGDDYYSAFMGDAANKPNASLGALRTAPFYALELRPSDLSTMIGVNTNARAQVVDSNNSPIPGLYAAGLDSNSLMRGLYPGGGSSIGPAMTFGYIAARDMAGKL
jgi:succinate dehydrogenase/fumarate reductase flavoprotein subunit